MATWNPRTFSFEQVLAAAHLNEIRDLLNRTAPAKVTAKGDIVAGSEAHEIGQLAVGTNNQVLIADSTQTLGVKWGTVGGVCRIVRNTAIQSLTNSAVTNITFQVEEFDTHGFADLATYADRITIPTGMDGYYQIIAGLAWQSSSTTGTRSLRLYHYDSSDAQLHHINNDVSGSYADNNMSVIFYMSAGDYILIKGYQNSGTTLGIMYGDDSFLSLSLIYKG